MGAYQDEMLRRLKAEQAYRDDPMRFSFAQGGNISEAEFRRRVFGANAYGFNTSIPIVPKPDAYAVLGLPHTATRAMLNKRHRQLAREHRDNEAKLTEVNNAYNAIKATL